MTDPNPAAGSLPFRLDWRVVAIWLLACVIAVFFAMILRDSAYYGGEWLPRSNDSLYHAKRILDAAVGTRGFYQFDDHIHAPIGSWISWPWGYDYLLAKATQLAVWIDPQLPPMKFLAYVPVVWILVNAALFLAATGQLGLSIELRLLAMLCFALSPVTQLLHAIGMIDHHYVEHTFMLLTVWLGLRWFRDPADWVRAVALAVAIGLAPAFHNGLFILQLLPLAAVFVLWLRGASPPVQSLRAFGIALLVTTQLILLPSEPYREGLFEFGLLSWFHFYIAVCTVAVLLYMSWKPYQPKFLAGLVVLGLALAVPMATEFIRGAGFLGGKLSVMSDIMEVWSPYKMMTHYYGAEQTASFYTWFVVLAPILLIVYAGRLVRERRPEMVYFSVVVLFGLSMLLAQYRLQHFGYFALFGSILLLVEEWRQRKNWNRTAVFAASLAVVFLGFQPALRERLFVFYAPGGDQQYAQLLPIFNFMKSECRKDPGVVLADSNDGAAIIYHSDCKVISLNFLLREQDKVQVEEARRLMRLPVSEIRRQRPDIKYLLARAVDFSNVADNYKSFDSSNPLARELFLSNVPPPGLETLVTLGGAPDKSGNQSILARLYRIEANATDLPRTTDRAQ